MEYTTTSTEPVMVISNKQEQGFPEQPLGARVVLLPIEEEDEEKSNIILPDSYKQAKKNELLLPAKVIAVGTKITEPIQTGDVVRVYPTQFEANLVVNKVEYLVYNERSIVTIKK